MPPKKPKSNRGPRARALPNVDARIESYLDTTGPSVLVHDWLPIMVELADGITADAFWKGNPFIDPQDRGAWRDAVCVPIFYFQAPAGLEKFGHCTALVNPHVFRELVQHYAVVPNGAKRITLGPPLRAEVESFTHAQCATRRPA